MDRADERRASAFAWGHGCPPPHTRVVALARELRDAGRVAAGRARRARPAAPPSAAERAVSGGPALAALRLARCGLEGRMRGADGAGSRQRLALAAAPGARAAPVLRRAVKGAARRSRGPQSPPGPGLRSCSGLSPVEPPVRVAPLSESPSRLSESLCRPILPRPHARVAPPRPSMQGCAGDSSARFDAAPVGGADGPGWEASAGGSVGPGPPSRAGAAARTRRGLLGQRTEGGLDRILAGVVGARRRVGPRAVRAGALGASEAEAG